MVEPIVVDTNVIVASCLEWEDAHPSGQAYIAGLEAGDFNFHLPMLVVVEVIATINRRARKNRLALLNAWKQNFVDWEKSGNIVLYTLDRERMEQAKDIALRFRLKGADSVISALAEELAIPLKTFDSEVLARFQQASV